MAGGDIVIGSIDGYEWPRIRPWLLSLVGTGFDGRIVLFAYGISERTVMACERHGAEVVEADESLVSHPYRHVNKERYLHYARFLRSIRPGAVDRVVSTDVGDLAFQRDPGAWLDARMGEGDLVVSSEGIAYEHEPWNRRNALAVYGEAVYEGVLRRRPVLNAGLVAGRPAVFAELCELVYAEVYSKPGNFSDQIVFNRVLAREEGRWRVLYTDHGWGWGCHGGVMGAPGRPEEVKARALDDPPVLKDGRVCTKGGEAYCVVHQYDRVPEWGLSLAGRGVP
jgi:hypothetical protein